MNVPTRVLDTFAQWDAFLCCAYLPLPRPGDTFRVEGVWLTCDSEGYVRLASESLALVLETNYRNGSNAL